MNIIQFETYFQYFQNKIIEFKNEFLPDSDINFLFFKNDGEYHKHWESYDNSVLIDMVHLLTSSDGFSCSEGINFEILASETRRDELITLFDNIRVYYVNRIISDIPGSEYATIDFAIDGITYGDKFDARGEESFNISFTTSIITAPDLKFSNNVLLYPDNSTDVYNYQTINISRTVILEPSPEKNTVVKNRQSQTALVVAISGPLDSSDFCNKLYSDIVNGSYYGTVYKLRIVNGSIIMEKDFYLHSGTTTITKGTIIAYTAQFVEAKV